MSAPARERPGGGEQGTRPATGRSGTELITEHGRTSIADSVVAKVVGVATREVPGVHEMGSGAARAMGAVRERIPGGVGGSRFTQGVGVEVGERQAAIDLDLIVDYGVSIPDLAAGVRRNVVSTVEKVCGLEVTEVNITIDDVFLPGDGEEQQPTGPRVE
jgi:uncharacterized alkaline shock family protein YloU